MDFTRNTSTINDVSAAAGLRGKIFKSWNFDLSNTFGKTHLIIILTANATLREIHLHSLMQED
jgi:iron complex outermembrane receptor protein